MSEPITSAIGVKLTTLVAGFAGGVVSLAFIQNLSRWQAVMAVVVGALTANYLTPLAVDRLGVTRPEFQNGMAFLVGLLAMNIIPALNALFTAQNLRSLIARFLGISSSQPTQGEGDAK